MYQRSNTLPLNRCTLTIQLLFVLVVSAPLYAQDIRSIHDGIEYAQDTKTIDGKVVKINILRLDLTKVRLDVVHAMDTAIGTEKTSSIAQRHNAVAAINAGFFRLDTSIFAGDPSGLLLIDNKILSESIGERATLILNESAAGTEAFIDRIGLVQSLNIGGERFENVGINRQRKADDIVVYTPEFHRTTLTSGDGIEILVKGNRIKGVFDGTGSNLIPEYSFVISASGKQRDMLAKIAKLNVAVTANMKWSKLPSQLFRMKKWDAIAGVPMLVKNGKIDVSWQEERSSKAFVDTRHPRTAVAKLHDGKFLMVTLDGRSETSAGIGLYDLAAYLLELGAVDAMNLDGGGSTTMYIDGKVVNQPSGSEERKVSDAIIVRPRAKQTAQPPRRF